MDYDKLIQSALNEVEQSNSSENLEKTRISCKDVTFKIFGFSLASINTVLSLVLSVTMIRLIIKK